MKISLIIPTKNRLGTLKYCVESCLASNYTELEIIISNNQSEDGTADYLGGLTDKRLKILTTKSPLSMRANFEFALDHATGEYIFYIGDDDGITPFGIDALAYFIRDSGADAVNWSPLPYIWPDTVYPGALSSMVLKLRNFSSSYQLLDHQSIFERFRQGSNASYMEGAKIYHGCVSRKLINKVREKSGNLYFGAMAPDVFVAIANLKFLDKFIGTGCAISISGKSAQSNAWTSKPTGDKKRMELFYTDSEESIVPDPHSIVDLNIRSLRVHELDALMLINDNLCDGKIDINYQNWINLFANSLICIDQTDYDNTVEKLGKLAKSLNAQIPDIPEFKPQIDKPGFSPREKIKYRPKHIRCYTKKLANVADASKAVTYDAQKIVNGSPLKDTLNWWKFQYDFSQNVR